MNKFFCIFGFIGACLLANTANSASPAGVNTQAKNTNYAGYNTTTQLRGNAGLANVYQTNQRNNYFMINQPDVDTACRERIFACLTDYCGDTAVVPGVRESKCQYATESELYNYTLLCLQRDTSILLPQYGVNTMNGKNGMNTAARLCPSYVQQELMAYLSMANMANQLSKQHSDLCLQRRQELEAAMACHSAAMAYGNETDSMLRTQLNDYCGAGVPGGSAEMVTRFANAGNTGASVWGWAEKIVSLEMNNKGENWEAAVNSVLAGYANRMNLACGENLQLNLATTTSGSSQPSNLQTIAALATGVAFGTGEQKKVENPYQFWPTFMEIESSSEEMYTYDRAEQAVKAALTNTALTQNSFFTPTQVDNMQQAYIKGTKVFIIRDGARCFIVQVAQMTPSEMSSVAQQFANCVSK
ncbi:MAG: hypothetical protein IJY99_04795 [Alphaproteobacteria bacterium]|nr:hypothetical protein [Alphaproteobacteria bacterium]